MKPHKNALADDIQRRKKFKPKVLIGDLRKPNTEFTSDLVTIAHQSRLIRRKNAEMGTEESKSLEQIRLKDRIRHRTRVMIKDQEDDLTDCS